MVFLPGRTAKSLGGLCPLVLCTRVGTAIHFIDPNTLRIADISHQVYWRDPFQSLATSRCLIEFYVMDVELTGETVGKFALADVQVVKASDFGRTTQYYFARTHLGNLLKAGDVVLGYDVSTSNFNNSDFDEATAANRLSHLSDVVIVKKSYAHLRRQGGSRRWKLRDLDKDESPNDAATESSSSASNQQQGQSRKKTPALSGSQRMEAEKAARDMEMFLQELEEDSEMRQAINVYRNQINSAPVAISDDVDPEEMKEIEIPLEELLDELTLGAEGEVESESDIEMMN